MKAKFYSISLMLILSLSTQAAIIYTGGDAVIPDNNTIGLTETLSINGLDISITAVTLEFTLTGGFGTDLTGYLRLGNQETSPFYDLSSLIQSHSTISASGVTFDVDVGLTFTGYNPNDTWTLFFADTSSGGATTLKSDWSLDIEAVPEPVNVALGIFSGLMGGVVLWRHWSKSRRQKVRIGF